MTALLLFAFASGIVTILSPCILPMLPIVLTGAVGEGKARPLGIVTGFVASFSVFTLTLTAIVDAIGIPSGAMRIVAVIMILGFGLSMIVPRFEKAFEMAISKITSTRTGNSAGKNARRNGFGGGVVVGASLGLIWTPCVGPIMASVIALALTRSVDGGSILITIAYSLGTSIPMFAVIVGGRTIINRVPGLTRRMGAIRKGFGVAMIAVGIAVGFGWDRTFQNAVLAAFPNYGAGLTAIEDTGAVRSALDRRSATKEPAPVKMMASTAVRYDSFAVPPRNGKLGDYGPAPELVTRGDWFNADGLPATEAMDGRRIRMSDLRGKVVLLDFWTYSCVNCVRTLPHLADWYEKFREEGFVIIGVHTPEFEFEKSPDNLVRAMRDLGVVWPVVQDNEFVQWRAYNNRYWPAHYFIDAEGHIRYFHFGEGEYDTSEKVIRTLLREAGMRNISTRADSDVPETRIDARTPETYLGYGRATGFISDGSQPKDERAAFTIDREPGMGEWGISGEWTISREYIESAGSGRLQFGFDAKDVFLVIEPAGEGGNIQVELDGTPASSTVDVVEGVLRPTESRLYHLVNLDTSGSHVLNLNINGTYRLFAFTFG